MLLPWVSFRSSDTIQKGLSYSLLLFGKWLSYSPVAFWASERASASGSCMIVSPTTFGQPPGRWTTRRVCRKTCLCCLACLGVCVCFVFLLFLFVLFVWLFVIYLQCNVHLVVCSLVVLMFCFFTVLGQIKCGGSNNKLTWVLLTYQGLQRCGTG